ncbi:hypothetical protein [Kaistella sp.]|uniref:hypothetical protein n=1 Tax=Kaistella sp. TaxID=2782235 RepID=UPI003C548CFF
MGSTIHFNGQLKSEDVFTNLMLFCTQYSEKQDWEYTLFKNQKNILFRVKDGKVNTEDFIAKGIHILPVKNCEPLLMEFDDDLYFHSSCKSQFAGVEIHKQVIDFLRKIEPFFEDFEVIDETDYWQTNDEDLLKNKIDFLGKAIEEISKTVENLKNDKWKYN